jgi:hypothetical protein
VASPIPVLVPVTTAIAMFAPSGEIIAVLSCRSFVR